MRCLFIQTEGQNEIVLQKLLFMKTLYTLLLTISTLSIFAQAGTPDESFNGTGKFYYDFGNQDNLQCVAIQPNDQKIVVAGTALNASFAGRLTIIRLHTDGTLDNSFSDDGTLMIEDYTESYAYACHVDDEGKITVAGTAADPSYQFSTLVLRFLEDGTPDNSFGDNGVVRIEVSPMDDFANNMVIQEDGKIVLAGSALDENYDNLPTVLRLLSDGSLDTEFGNNGIAQIAVEESDNKFYDVKIDSQNRIVACGHYGFPLTETGQFNLDVLVARFNSDGSIDNTFGTNGNVITPVSQEYVEAALGLTILNGDKIVVAGYTTLLDFSFDALLIGYNEDGSLDDTFGTDGIKTFDYAVQDVFNDIALDSEGRIIAAGTSGGFFFDDRDFLLMRLSENGVQDNSFGNNGASIETILSSFDEANGIAIQDNGKIVAAGRTNNGANNDAGIIRYHEILVDMTTEIISASMTVWPNPVQSGSEIFFGGNLKNVQTILWRNAVGQLIEETKVNTTLQKTYVPSSIASGHYCLTITNANGETLNKMVYVEGK